MRWLALLVFIFASPMFALFMFSGPAMADHVAPHTCGVKSGSFARICRASAYPSCLKAAARHVKGFSKAVCAQRETACRSCLSEVHVCISKIGHAKPRRDYTCEECTGKFDRCIGKRYPKIKD